MCILQAFHGCPTCFPNRQNVLPKSTSTAEEVYQRTMERQRELEALGYTVTVKWECDLRKELHESPEMKDFFDNAAIYEPLDPREGFFGGTLFLCSIIGHV